MSFVVKGSFGKIEVDHIVNGLILNDIIIFDAVPVDKDTIVTIAIDAENKGYQEALNQVREINNRLKEMDLKKENADSVPKQKYKWGEWKEESLLFSDPFSGARIPLDCEVRTNGKRVEAKIAGLKASASCNFEKGDKFDYNFGRKLAKRRLIVKIISLQANNTNSVTFAKRTFVKN